MEVVVVSEHLYQNSFSNGIKPPRWVDGTAVDFDGWADGKPESHSDDHCAVINKDRSGEWKTYKCTKDRLNFLLVDGEWPVATHTNAHVKTGRRKTSEL